MDASLTPRGAQDQNSTSGCPQTGFSGLTEIPEEDIYLSEENIKKSAYTARLYLWSIKVYGPSACADAMNRMFSMIALVAIFLAGFISEDLPEIAITAENNIKIRMYGVCAVSSQLFAVATVILSILLSVQLGFYNSKSVYEISFFAKKFGAFTTVPIFFMIFSLFLGSLAIITRCVMIYDPIVWITNSVIASIIFTPCIIAYPWMDPILRRMREQQARPLMQRKTIFHESSFASA